MSLGHLLLHSRDGVEHEVDKLLDPVVWVARGGRGVGLCLARAQGAAGTRRLDGDGGGGIFGGARGVMRDGEHE